MQENTKKFWEGSTWDSIHIIKEGHILHPILIAAYKSIGGKNPPKVIYLPGLQFSLDSTYVASFEKQDELEQNILLNGNIQNAKNLKDANLDISKMNAAYSNASSIASKFAIYLYDTQPFDFSAYMQSSAIKAIRIHILTSIIPNQDLFFSVSSLADIHYILAFSNFIRDISSDLNDSVDYGGHWRNTISNQVDALSLCAKTTNSIFSLAQQKSETLNKMGINHPQYVGNARQNYVDYINFITLSYKYISQKEGCSNSQTLPQKYACAYNSLEQLSTLSQDPGILPLFDRNGANLSQTYNLLSSPTEGSLLYASVDFDSKLNSSIQIFEEELQIAHATATLNQELAKSAQSYIEDNNPELFDDYDDFDNTLSRNILPSQEFGTISSLNSNLQQYYSSSNSQFDLAQKTLKNKKQDYAALTILHFQNSSILSQKAIGAAIELNSSMQQKSSSSCAYAQYQISALEYEINSRNSTDFSQSASLNSAIDLLQDARAQYQNSIQISSLGKKYSNCKKAATIAISGMNIAKNPQEFAKNKTIDDALEHFASLLSAAKKIDYDSTDAYSKKYEELKSRYDSGLYVDLFEISSQSDSLHNELNYALSEQTQIYLSIRQNAFALQSQTPSILTNFDKTLSPYREESRWSLQALQNSKLLTSTLQKLQSQTNSQALESLKSYVCKNANFIPNAQNAQTQVRYDTGGIYSIHNPFNLTIIQNFNIKCPFQIPFSNDEITQKSQNINSAFSSGSDIELFLNSISPNQNIELRFSSTKIAVSQTLNSCNAKISNSGILELNAIYSLKPVYYPNSLLISIPWPTHSSGTATLLTNDGQLSQGVFASTPNGEPKVDFTISQFSDTTKSFNIKILQNEQYSLNKLNYLTNISDTKNTIFISYYLSLENLPPCSQIDIEIPENTNSPIENLQINADYAKLSSPKINYVGQTKWFSTLTNVPPNGSVLISVQYDSINPSEWFNSTLSSLRQKAYELNDSQSLTLLNSAQLAYDSSNQKDALELISQVQQRISAQTPDNAKSRLEFEQELEFANKKLSILTNMSPTLFKDVSQWSQTLQTAIDESQTLWLNADLQKARKTLRSKSESLNDKISKEANSIYSKLSSDALVLDNVAILIPNISYSSKYTQHLNSAKDSLTTSNPFDSLLSLQNASETISTNTQISLNMLNSEQAVQLLQKQKLISDSQSLSLDYDKYLEWLAELGSAKTLALPSLSTKEAKSIQSSLTKILSDYDEKTPKNLKDSLEQFSQNKLVLNSAQEQILDSQIRLQTALADFESLAAHLHQTAKLSVERLEDKQPDSSSLLTLKQDLSSVEKMFEVQNYADAISLCESIIKRAGASTPNSQPQLPLEILVLTAILILVIAGYMYLQQSPPKKEPTLQVSTPKTLEKA